MSKVFVIPDVHLKPWIFDQAIDIMENTDCERTVCVGDLVDDWGCEHEVELYSETLDKAISFARRYPDTLWCYGNHDLSYLWDQYDHPGFSLAASDIVVDKFEQLRDTVPSPDQVAIIHKLDNTIFSHAGLARDFVERRLYGMMDDLECLIDTINEYGAEELWEDDSPIWVRPQDGRLVQGLYPDGFHQVVGHTPVREILVQEGIITVDTFSTYSNGMPYGNEDLCWVDTVTGEHGIIS